MRPMIDVKQFVYSELSQNATLSGYVGDRIFPRIAPQGTGWPLVVFNRITSGKIDNKGIRNEYFQVSIWGKSENTNEAIMGVIASMFHGLKKPPIKHCDVQRLDDTFDKDTSTFGNHVTVHIKMLEAE